MSDYDEDEIDTEEETRNEELPKDLRRQLNAEKKARKALENEVAQFRAEQRKTNVAKLLEQAGANPKYAKFYNGEDSSEEAVKAWIQSESDLLGVQKPDPEPENADQVRGISQAMANIPQARPAATPSASGPGAEAVARMNAAKTPEEFWAALQAGGLRTS